MLLSTPRLVVGGVAGDSGKTLVALGIARALSARGLMVSPYKKGPDYIDAAWLGAAARRPGRNLDTFIMEAAGIGEALTRGGQLDLLLVEGNRGLHDGFDEVGSHSTAALAELLRAPVILVLEVHKMTRTAAAVVLGCQAMAPEMNLAGVVLNRVGTTRQEKLIRASLEAVSGPPVLGAIPRLPGDPFPSRHLGLVTAVEHPGTESALTWAAEVVARHVDLDSIVDLARTAPETEFPSQVFVRRDPAVRIGVFRDEAFSFYYPENLEILRELGAELVTISPLADERLPEIDALFIGGGFPEMYIERLAENQALGKALRQAVEGGLPVYAECGGLMYLATELIFGGNTYPMAGVLDLVTEMTSRPNGHGYVLAEVDRENPFFPLRASLRGHEFHYSRVVAGKDRAASVLRLQRGHGIGAGRDGIMVGRVWASYLHLHALGTPTWAEAMMRLAQDHQRERTELFAS